MLQTLLLLALGYLMGSVPYGLLLTRAAGLGDIRAIGSGNIGATNVLRTGNKALAAATLALDLLKGTAGVLVGAWLGGSDGALAGGVGAFLGHIFPVWLGFKGGKGVATYIGVLAGLAWPVALLFCAIWLLIAGIFRISSLSALVASLVAPIGFLIVDARHQMAAPGPAAIAATVLAVLIFLRHRANIERLIRGTEPRIGARKPDGGPPGGAGSAKVLPSDPEGS
ncbi:MAG: glycerol-3-phosphate 1-O-acyltransferase PlsY [Hyphomicrobiaceae bacterium]